MDVIADILLVAAALAATAYCVVLSRRLRRFSDLEKGVGGAIAVLSNQVEDMTKTLKSAQNSALGSAKSLAGLTSRAEGAAKKLELLVASMHDLPEPALPPSQFPATPVSQPVPTNHPTSAAQDLRNTPLTLEPSAQVAPVGVAPVPPEPVQAPVQSTPQTPPVQVEPAPVSPPEMVMFQTRRGNNVEAAE